jgi:hypothetical protein
MCGSPKWRASARAIVPLPLAAGPSTAMIMRLLPGMEEALEACEATAQCRPSGARLLTAAIPLWQGAAPTRGGPGAALFIFLEALSPW